MNTIVDVIIPSYRPDERFPKLLHMLSVQTVPLHTIHLINTEKEVLEKALSAMSLTIDDLKEQYPNLNIRHISASDFDHAGTRNMGMQMSEDADFAVLMTQDALPADDRLIENLIRPFETQEDLAVSYARQLPNQNAKSAERYSREFNYPAAGRIKSAADVKELGIKTYFCSDVCACYKRKLFTELGGFEEPAIFNEDMVYAGNAVQKGYKICYSAEAKVYHSHNYGAMQQFHRNFDLGVSQAQHPEIFSGVSSEGEGVRFAKAVIRYLIRHNSAGEIPGFVIGCAARLVGYRLGKAYTKLPRKICLCFTSNKAFWNHI